MVRLPFRSPAPRFQNGAGTISIGRPTFANGCPTFLAASAAWAVDDLFPKPPLPAELAAFSCGPLPGQPRQVLLSWAHVQGCPLLRVHADLAPSWPHRRGVGGHEPG